tara:strand:+ start:87 stop:374 length:288 start_codon:yes stop_codon:yes gene_type:complete
MNFLFIFLFSCYSKEPFLKFPATVDSINGRWVTVEIIDKNGKYVLVQTPTSYFPIHPAEGEQWYYRFVDCSRCEDLPPLTTKCVVRPREDKLKNK